MRNIINILKCVLFLGAGILLLLAPYSKVKMIFPNAPSAVVVKVMGGIVLLCGLVILLLSSGL